MRRILPLLAAASLTLGCAETRYVLQAIPGQAQLYTGARDVDEVLADPRTDARTRVLLEEVEHILAYGADRGLSTKGNYTRYVDLDRSAVVYFLAASKPLAFEPKTWTFPLVGSFPYTGWFSYFLGRRERQRLEGRGWDVYMRSVRAYSTGGWLHDPVLSTMLLPSDDAYRYLTNTLFHELTHANFFVGDQATFNESLASFVGDEMAGEYLADRFGPESDEVTQYHQELDDYAERSKIVFAAYEKLEKLYASDKPDAVKLREKAAILRQLRIDADLSYEPNNASLIGFKTYNSGLPELAALFETCGRDWHRFFALVEAVDSDDFPSEQLEELGPFIKSLGRKGCPAPGGKR